MNKVLFNTLSALVLSQSMTTALAQQVVDRPVVPIHDNDVLYPETTKSFEQQSLPEANAAEKSVIRIDQAELAHNLQLTESLLNQAILQRQWDKVAELLAIYQTFESVDELLISYAQGALYRQQGKHSEAVREFRKVLAANPQNSYLRFDLAIMLLENRQYMAAEDQFYKVKADNSLPANMLQMVDQYLHYLQQQTKLDWGINLRYVSNNNVNNATSEVLAFGNWTIGNIDDKPIKARGLDYTLWLNKDFNLKNNHFLSLESQLYGVEYWHVKGYDETNLRLALGYKFQNSNKQFSLMPFVDKTLYDHKSYGQNYGTLLSSAIWLNNKLRWSSSYQLAHKTYSSKAMTSYQGNLHALSSSLTYYYSPSLQLSGSIILQADRLKKAQNSSFKNGLRLSISNEWPAGFSTNIAYQYSKRRFKDDYVLHVWNLGRRHDLENKINIALWHKKIHFWGVTPSINYEYKNIKSTIPSLYSTRNQQWFINLQKKF